MKPIVISSFLDYLEQVDKLKIKDKPINLFRGQSEDQPLLPIIARANPNINTLELEKTMLDDLERRSSLLIKKEIHTKWEWLILAQHFGMQTRLLDWSSNPLVGLWFACRNPFRMKQNSFVYVFSASDDLLVDLNSRVNPFDNARTQILRPHLNNERIIAQFGWFTAHRYSTKQGKFVDLSTNKQTKEHITKIEIPYKLKKEILRKVSILGVNNSTMFPDLVGLCEHLNWKYINQKK